MGGDEVTEAQEFGQSIFLQCGTDTGVGKLLENIVSLDLGKDIQEAYENGM